MIIIERFTLSFSQHYFFTKLKSFEYLRMEVSWRCNKSFVKISYCFDIPRLFNALTNDKKQTYTLYIVVNMKYYSMTWYHNYKPTHFLRKVVELFLRHRAFYHEISKVVCFWFIFDWIQIVVISEQICFTSVWNSLKYIEKLTPKCILDFIWRNIVDMHYIHRSLSN